MQGICSDITEKIIGSAYTVWNSLGAGFLEKVYEKALLHEISKSGTQATAQHPLKVYYDGVVVGEYFVDLFVEISVIVELKAGKAIEGASRSNNELFESYVLQSGFDYKFQS